MTVLLDWLYELILFKSICSGLGMGQSIDALVHCGIDFEDLLIDTLTIYTRIPEQTFV